MRLCYRYNMRAGNKWERALINFLLTGSNSLPCFHAKSIGTTSLRLELLLKEKKKKKKNQNKSLFTLSLPTFDILSICCDCCITFLLSLVFLLISLLIHKWLNFENRRAKITDLQMVVIIISINGSLSCENSSTEYCRKQRDS